MKIITALIVTSFLLFAGCSSLKITSSWKASGLPEVRYTKILVVGLIEEKNRQVQENMENHLAGDLAAMGYITVTALQEYGPHAFEKMDEKEALQKIKSSGVDAVVTIVLLDKKKERRYVSAQSYNAPYGYYYNNFWQYRSSLFDRVYRPGYYVTDTKYFWESNFYSMRTDSLLYSVQTRSFASTTTGSMAHEYGQLIARHMKAAGILH